VDVGILLKCLVCPASALMTPCANNLRSAGYIDIKGSGGGGVQGVVGAEGGEEQDKLIVTLHRAQCCHSGDWAREDRLVSFRGGNQEGGTQLGCGGSGFSELVVVRAHKQHASSTPCSSTTPLMNYTPDATYPTYSGNQTPSHLKCRALGLDKSEMKCSRKTLLNKWLAMTLCCLDSLGLGGERKEYERGLHARANVLVNGLVRRGIVHSAQWHSDTNHVP
jgi:hypothetical protein